MAALTAAPAAATSDEAQWILDTGAHYDRCLANTRGIRTKRNDLGAIVSASGHVFTFDYSITVNIDALQKKD